MSRLLHVAGTNRIDTQPLSELVQLRQGKRERGRIGGHALTVPRSPSCTGTIGRARCWESVSAAWSPARLRHRRARSGPPSRKGPDTSRRCRLGLRARRPRRVRRRSRPRSVCRCCRKGSTGSSCLDANRDTEMPARRFGRRITPVHPTVPIRASDRAIGYRVMKCRYLGQPR
jgi:hypothetical protein